jgi:hypothetical protein
MMNRKRVRTMSPKTTHIRKASRRTGSKSNPKGKKGPLPTDYLLEEHPELGFPIERVRSGSLKSELPAKG